MDVLRILACLGVILNHISASCLAQGYAAIGTSERLFCGILNVCFNGWPVPIFVMITGFFFLQPEKKLPLKKLYEKNIFRLVLSLVFWTWFYAITLHCRYTSFYPFGGQTNNFWYIGMCIGLYISMPVLRSVAANAKLLTYSCWIWLFIQFYLYIGYYVEVPIIITDYVFVGYIGICLWGYYLSRVQLGQRQTRIVYTIGVFSLIARIVLPMVTNGKVRYFSMESPDSFLTSIAIFLFVMKHPIQLSPKKERIVTHLSGMTFGIYMVHTFVVVETFTRLHRFFPNVYVLVPLAILVTIVSSYFIILIIKQIPYLKKWVV
jgi:surface polysaccharide O-acyltransferase-like enzyme